MMPRILEKFHEHYQDKISCKRLIDDKISARSKFLFFGTGLIASLMVALPIIVGLPKYIGFLMLVPAFSLAYIAVRWYRKKRERRLRKVERKCGFGKQFKKYKFLTRLQNVQSYLLWKFNGRKVGMTREELGSLGADIREIHGTHFFRFKSPMSLIGIVLAIEAIVVTFLDFSTLTVNEKALIIFVTTMLPTGIIFVWFVLRETVEPWVNSERKSHIEISVLLTGMKYNTRR